jgi:hypothetical protein
MGWKKALALSGLFGFYVLKSSLSSIASAKVGIDASFFLFP